MAASTVRDLTTLILDDEAPEVIRAAQLALYIKVGPEGYTGLPFGVTVTEAQRELLMAHRDVLALLRPKVTWACCMTCGRGRLLKRNAQPSGCDLTYGCEGRYIIAKTPKRAPVEKPKRVKKGSAADDAGELTLFDMPANDAPVAESEPEVEAREAEETPDPEHASPPTA